MTDREEFIRKQRKAIKLRKAGVIILAAIVILGALALTVSTESFKRYFKTVVSDHTGGMDRIVTVYDENGNVLREYEGKIDIQENSYGNKVLFDLDGRRISIYNAIVIAEEQE